MSASKKVLFIDRDGTLIMETIDEQIDSFAKLEFYPGALTWLPRIAKELDFELAMVTNQDGLGTPAFPEKDFWEVQQFIVQCFENEEIHFEKVFIDKSFPEENLPTRKPGTGMLTEFFSDKYDLPNSFVIGDRITDVKLGKNLGCKCVWMNDGRNLGSTDITEDRHQLAEYSGIETRDWQKIYEYLKELA